jgi:NADH-quinone oxidoreductase subunit C
VEVDVTDGEQTIGLLRERYPDEVVDAGSYRDQHWVELKADRLVEICEWLRDDPANRYDFLVDVTAVHWPDDPQPMELVYHLQSYERNDRLRLKVRAADAGPVPTLCDVWRSADWNERETYDMLGIRFRGHPDLRRILMPEDYSDFPLRKELPLYRG